MRIFYSIVIILALINSIDCQAQSGIKDSSMKFTFMSVGFTQFVTGGDLETRFANTSMISGSLMLKRESNFLFGISGGFMFGDKVDEPGILSGIAASNGQIIGVDGLYADVRLFQRGFQIAFTVGKIFSFDKPNPNSGILLMGGPGFIQHKIRIETINNTTPNLQDDYLEGYDHLTNGVALHEFVGFIYFGNKKFLNFIGGFEFIQGFTKNRRNYNFDTPGETEGSRLDLYYGIKLSWALPFYKKVPDEFYFY
jgi:hypothetical protein